MKKITNLTDFILGCMGTLFSLYVYFILIPATISIPQRASTFYDRPDILPKAVILLILIISLILTIASFSKKNEITNQQAPHISIVVREVVIPVSTLIVCCIAFLILLPRIGYITVSIFFLGCLLLVFGFRNILLLITLSITFPIGMFIFFERALKVFLP